MNFEYEDSVTLLDAACRGKLYPKLLIQLNKDFGLANVSLGIPENLDPKELPSLVREKVYHLLLEKFDEYLQLLYIIDIPERDLKHIHMTDVVEVAEQMTLLILRRELQKVWYKTRYTP